MVHALEESVVLGVVTNQSFLLDILVRPFFVDGDTFTTTLGETEFLSLNFQSGLRDLQSDNRKEVARSKLPVDKATRTLHGTDLVHLGWEHEVAFG